MNLRKCPQCHETVGADSDICPRCGANFKFAQIRKWTMRLGAVALLIYLVGHFILNKF